ncbi:MAG: hypothetical protein C0404_10110 [Verrucomicrobia bacterium]|nr:hypothetical protein [Verrucomicrobiota bacterium]
MNKHIVIAIVLASVIPASGADTQTVKKVEAAAPPVAVLYDTGAALPDAGKGPLQIEDGKWTKIENGKTPKSFKGDAVLFNGSVAAVIRKDGAGVELFAGSGEGLNHRARLAPLAGEGTAAFEGAAASANDGTVVAVDVNQKGGDKAGVVFSLSAGTPLLKATAKGKPEGLRVSAPCRFGILPDFFTDDLMIDARDIQAARVEIPSEHFFLQMLADGASILTVVWDKNERDINLNVAGDGDKRLLSGTDVYFGKDGNIWAGCMEKKGIWFSKDLAKGEEEKGMALDWQVPFPAKWKGDFTCTNRTISSASFNQWIKTDAKTGKSTVALPQFKRKPGEAGYEGPFVVYPARRDETTPLDQILLDDIMMRSLGSGPCSYILDVSGRTSSGKGIFTCSYDWTVPRMTLGGKEEAGFWKDDRVFLRKMHKDVLVFMNHIQDRIGMYAGFRKDMLAYLDEQAKKNADLGAFIGKLKAQVSKLPDKRPSGDQAVKPLLQEVEKCIYLDTPEQVVKSKNSTRPVPNIAEGQDDHLAACRRMVKLLRAMAVMEMMHDPAAGKSPAAGEIVKTVRAKSQEILRNPAHHEGSEAGAW